MNPQNGPFNRRPQGQMNKSGCLTIDMIHPCPILHLGPGLALAVFQVHYTFRKIPFLVKQSPISEGAMKGRPGR